MFFRNMNPRKKERLLVVLITICWTLCVVEVIVGWLVAERWWYSQAALLFLIGLAFVEAHRHVEIPPADSEQGATNDP
jgi:hypothetical protein